MSHRDKAIMAVNKVTAENTKIKVQGAGGRGSEVYKTLRKWKPQCFGSRVRTGKKAWTAKPMSQSMQNIVS